MTELFPTGVIPDSRVIGCQLILCGVIDSVIVRVICSVIDDSGSVIARVISSVMEHSSSITVRVISNGIDIQTMLLSELFRTRVVNGRSYLICFIRELTVYDISNTCKT